MSRLIPGQRYLLGANKTLSRSLPFTKPTPKNRIIHSAKQAPIHVTITHGVSRFGIPSRFNTPHAVVLGLVTPILLMKSYSFFGVVPPGYKKDVGGEGLVVPDRSKIPMPKIEQFTFVDWEEWVKPLRKLGKLLLENIEDREDPFY